MDKDLEEASSAIEAGKLDSISFSGLSEDTSLSVEARRGTFRSRTDKLT